jgi:hypothetical protein
MISSSSQNDTSHKILEKMRKLRARHDLRMTMPSEGCHATGTHLAGMFFLLNYDYFKRLVERDCR